MKDRHRCYRLHALAALLASVAILGAAPDTAGAAPVSAAPARADPTAWRTTGAGTTTPEPGVPPIATTGSPVRMVVRVGAALFAVGGIATYVASGARRTTRGDGGPPER